MSRTILVFSVLGWAACAGPLSAEDLIWGGDKVGGAPFIFDDGKKQIGFETELAEYLAEELGRTAKFEQVPWDNLPDALINKRIHIVLNGYEYSEERNEGTLMSLPYFVYNLRLIAPKAESDPQGVKSIRTWKELPHEGDRPRRKVSVLRGSASQDYMTKRFGQSIELIPADDVAEMLAMVADGRANASVQDSPAARYYVRGIMSDKLMVVDEPVAESFYVVLVREDDKDLLDKINAAIKKGMSTGKFKEIFKNYNLWDGDQQRLEYYLNHWPPIEDDLFAAGEADQQAKEYTRITLESLKDKLIWAALMTLALAFASMPFALLLGLFIAVGRTYGPLLVRIPLIAYVEIMRGTPLILQMFLWFYLVPPLLQSTNIGVLIAMTHVPYFVYGVVGLALNYSASEAENFRAGLQAIHRGQMEAALALGMRKRTALRRVIVPQAFRIVIPSITNDFIALLKDTSVCSLILITELTGLYYQYKYHREIVIDLALTIATIYLCLSYPLALAARTLERRLKPRSE